MSDPRQCPQCGTPLPAGALGGLCPACLLKQGASADTATQPETPPFEPPSIAELARLFPELEILRLLGKGGMGAVYQARQSALDRMVALKILPSRGGADAGFAERFNREARALGRLSHPNIVAVHEFGQKEGLHYFIMEFVDGVNLRQLQQSGRLSPREALEIVPQLCDALQYAHDQGVVHRDIKPENVLVDRKGRVKIADFGLAKILGADPAGLRLTAEGHLMGTPHYMSPEQVERPLEVDHRADIYSLGVVFYEMLTGELPLGRFAPPSRKVQIDVRLDDVVLRTLEKEPERRYQQAGEVKTRVESITQTPGQKSTPPPPPSLPAHQPAPPTDGRNVLSKIALGMALAVLLLILVTVGAVLLSIIIPAVARHRAQTQGLSPTATTNLTWSPTLAPGEKPDPMKISQAAKTLTDEGSYEEALQRYLWYWNHATQYQPGTSGVRLSFVLSDWVELGRRYPKAKQALVEIRDQINREFAEGRGYFALFQDVFALNNALQQPAATETLFKSLREKDPALAEQCFFVIKPQLVKNGEYEYALSLIPDPQAAFNSYVSTRERTREFDARMAALRSDSMKRREEFNAKMKKEHPEWTVPPPIQTPDMSKIQDGFFINQTRDLIEILVGTGHQDEAEKIQAQAVAVLDDPRLKSAVADAEKAVAAHKGK